MQVLVGGGNPLILIGALMVLLIAIGAVVVALIVRSRSRARFKRRLQSFTQAAVAAASTKKGQQKNLLIQGKLNEIEGAGKRRSERLTLRNRIEMAGLSVTTKQFNIASAVAGLLAFLVPLIMGISFLPTFCSALPLVSGHRERCWRISPPSGGTSSFRDLRMRWTLLSEAFSPACRSVSA